jgi:hypothetical protein
MRPSSSYIFRHAGPCDPAVETGLQRFNQMNEFVTARGGWITSLPGEATVRLECLLGSIVPSDLRASDTALPRTGRERESCQRQLCSGSLRMPPGSLSRWRQVLPVLSR